MTNPPIRKLTVVYTKYRREGPFCDTSGLNLGKNIPSTFFIVTFVLESQPFKCMVSQRNHADDMVVLL